MKLKVDIGLPYTNKTLSFTFKGRVLGIIGASGSGKSTFLNIMAGFKKPRWGKIIVNNRVWNNNEEDIIIPPWERHAVMVHQDSLLFPHLSVKENIEFGGEKYTEILSNLLVINHKLSSDINGLSGGEQQRVSLSRALNAEPYLLLLDEPFTALDQKTKQKIKKALDSWTYEKNIPYIIVSHDKEMVYDLAEMIIDFDELPEDIK